MKFRIRYFTYFNKNIIKVIKEYYLQNYKNKKT